MNVVNERRNESLGGYFIYMWCLSCKNYFKIIK